MVIWFIYGYIATVAIGGYLYFRHQDRKEQRKRQASVKRKQCTYTATDGKKVYIDNGKVTISNLP